MYLFHRGEVRPTYETERDQPPMELCMVNMGT